MPDIFIARQPIYKRNLEVYAYELLYRSDTSNTANVIDGEDATSQVLVNALIEIGLTELVGKHRAFVNCTERYLLEGLPTPIAPTQVVLEVLEDILPSQALIDSLKSLRSAGYCIALDDFVFDESKRELLAQADVIKVDILAIPRDELKQQVAILREYDVKLLAEKVETQEDYARCKELGFDYFQGYFFCRPNIVKGNHTPSSKLTIMRLLAKINEPNLNFDELEKLILHDVSLSYRILRYINSALYSLSNKVDSIHRAITMLGLNAIKSWITILAMSNIDDKPYELMMVALTRAKMCEELAAQRRLDKNVAFTIGLLSSLDALMDRKLEDLLQDLPLSKEINQALLEFGGPLGSILRTVLAYEQGKWDVAMKEGDFTTSDLSSTYLDAIRWTEDTSGSLLSAANS